LLQVQFKVMQLQSSVLQAQSTAGHSTVPQDSTKHCRYNLTVQQVQSTVQHVQSPLLQVHSTVLQLKSTVLQVQSTVLQVQSTVLQVQSTVLQSADSLQYCRCSLWLHIKLLSALQCRHSPHYSRDSLPPRVGNGISFRKNSAE
jgi:hypothetical protein